MAMDKARMFLVFVAVVFAVTGCAFTGGKKIDTSSVQKIVHGKTTKKEILEMFGKPISITADEKDNETWIYNYTEMKRKSYIWYLVGPTSMAMPSMQETQTLVVVLNSKGVVIDHTHRSMKRKEVGR